VTVYGAEEASAATTRLTGMVTASLLLGLAVEVHEHRTRPPATRNQYDWFM
jgi:hypothetical protein